MSGRYAARHARRATAVGADLVGCWRLPRPSAEVPRAPRGKHTEGTRMARVRVVINRKGGVGKSTLAVNLAAVHADVIGYNEADDRRPVVVSIDPQGSAIWWADRLAKLPFDYVEAHRDPAGLALLDRIPAALVIVDTPGWMDDLGAGNNDDGMGEGPAAAAMRAVLDCADDVLIPLEPEPLSYKPTAETIERVVKPRGLSFRVVVNNWDPRDGTSDLEQTQAWVRAQGWPLARTVVRHYKVHTRAAAEGLVCTEYPPNRVSLQAREDMYRLALELEHSAAATPAPALRAVEGGR